jgi:hypothetical protein
MGPTYSRIAAIINHYEAALGVITATFITGSNLDNIDRTSMATGRIHFPFIFCEVSISLTSVYLRLCDFRLSSPLRLSTLDLNLVLYCDSPQKTLRFI